MPRIIHDPNEAECPTFDDEAYANFRDMLIAGHQGPGVFTHEEAAGMLRTSWQKTQDKKVALWNEQLQQDQVAREEEERVEKEQERLKHQEQEKEEGRAKREAERKKPKINAFDPDAIVPGYIPPRPSNYALNKIKNLKYVELDYFTIKGCTGAQVEREMTSNHDTLGLTRLDNVAVFQPISSLKPSKNIRRDEELGWEEMVFAKNKMLEQMTISGVWPATHIKATLMLFVELENHPVRSQHLGNQIVVVYAARARRHWFDMIEQDRGFNLGKIGDDLMRNVTHEVRDEARQNDMAEVKTIHYMKGPSLINLLFFPFHALLSWCSPRIGVKIFNCDCNCDCDCDCDCDCYAMLYYAMLFMRCYSCDTTYMTRCGSRNCNCNCYAMLLMRW
jgi:hypothetical protein